MSLNEPGSCKSCQTEVSVCYGGNLIGPKPGYWRKNSTTQTFIKCPFSAACLGISPPTYNPIGDCSYAYKGIMCAECEEGFSNTGSFKCGMCPEFKKNVLRITFLFLIL